MVAESKRTSECPTLNSVPGNTTLITVAAVNSVANTYQLPVAVLLGGAQFMGQINTPANSTATSNVIQGTLAWDSSYLYVGTANNHLKRVALSDF